MRVRTLLRLAEGVLLVSSLAACGGGGTTNVAGSTGKSTSTTYTIGGSLTGLSSGTGISVVLANGGGTLTLTGNGSFTFPAAEADGSAYDVTVSGQPLFPQRCSVTGGSGTVSGANVTNISVACTATVTETTLYSFQGFPTDGAQPYTGLIFDQQGDLYGTTRTGGAAGDGTVFELKPDGKGGYTETVLYSFGASSTDGVNPSAVILDGQGNLYGTTINGGTNGYGAVFEIE